LTWAPFNLVLARLAGAVAGKWWPALRLCLLGLTWAKRVGPSAPAHMLRADPRPYHLFVYRPVAKPEPPLF
jgi:hypothetical protein